MYTCVLHGVKACVWWRFEL